MGYTVAVVGATGAVGAQMIKMLEESTLPIDKIRLLASARSAGKTLKFKDQDITIEETTETDSFRQMHKNLLPVVEVLQAHSMPIDISDSIPNYSMAD